jgi:hypothetical protein
MLRILPYTLAFLYSESSVVPVWRALRGVTNDDAVASFLQTLIQFFDRMQENKHDLPERSHELYNTLQSLLSPVLNPPTKPSLGSLGTRVHTVDVDISSSTHTDSIYTAPTDTPRRRTQVRNMTPHKSSQKAALHDRVTAVEGGVRELVNRVMTTPMRVPRNYECTPGRTQRIATPNVGLAATPAKSGVKQTVVNGQPSMSGQSLHPALRDDVSPTPSCITQHLSMLYTRADVTQRSNAVTDSSIDELKKVVSKLNDQMKQQNEQFSELLAYLGLAHHEDEVKPVPLMTSLKELQEKVEILEKYGSRGKGTGMTCFQGTNFTKNTPFSMKLRCYTRKFMKFAKKALIRFLYHLAMFIACAWAVKQSREYAIAIFTTFMGYL